MSEAIKQPVSPEGIIQMQGVNKWYGQFHVLKDINLNVKPGRAYRAVRPSGSASPPPSAASTAWKSTSKGASWSMAWS
jgi:ABC-type phosphonate transport system ATPase subunit